MLANPHDVSCLIFLAWVEEYDSARELLDGAILAARAAGAPTALPLALGHRSEVALRAGDLATAQVTASEAVRLAEETGQAFYLTFLLVSLARVEALRGREADCRAHLTRACGLATAFGAEPIIATAAACRGLLELGAGRPVEAEIELAQAMALMHRLGVREPAVLLCAPDLIEARMRAGKPSAARSALAAFEERVEGAGPRWAAPAAARCRGLLASDAEFESHFEEALALHLGHPSLLERARTELCYGERLRRARRRTQARAQLERALATYERLGAEPWAERTRAEMRANGDRPRPIHSGAVAELTAQELQVALSVSHGATNREAAAALFLSRRRWRHTSDGPTASWACARARSSRACWRRSEEARSLSPHRCARRGRAAGR